MAAESMFTGNIELVMHTMLNKLKEWNKTDHENI